MKRQSGFAVVAVLVIAIALGLVSLSGWYVYESRHLSSTGSTSSSSSGDNTTNKGYAIVQGVVTEGPTSPVCASSGCSGSVVVADHTVQAKDGDNVVASTKTDSNGAYVMHLKPGHYIFVLSPPVGMGIIKSNDLSVEAGQSYTLNLSADTGIR